MSEMLYIKQINSEKLVLSDGSEFSDLTPYYPSWKVDDEVKVEEKEGKFSRILCKVIHKKTKQEIAAFRTQVPSNLEKRLCSNERLEEEYANLDKEIRIRKASGELIWLQDDSKWQMYLPALGNPGSWDIGDTVIVSHGVSKSTSKIYQMKNIQTNKELMAIFMGYER